MTNVTIRIDETIKKEAEILFDKLVSHPANNQRIAG